ncbi:MAG TPA: tRNA uridine-5-carboxymethylaminomethyl(34) synthesis GTPase MnmE [Gemmatimonadales bacterium]|nr:tRNA uridine-5-carboxymethylaminomethyl(34) synthesis GTPase MnmE [Gemmatimonadales bacterium]
MPSTPQDSGLTTHDSTIVAIATPPGLGALAVVRVAGPEAFLVARRVAPDLDLEHAREAQLVGLLGPEGDELDRALVTCFPAPHSFTGDDTVEFSVHGGALVPGLVVAAALAAGARLATPGEFTRRAVLNGKLDLLQAEAVGDLIGATAPGQARVALHQLDGGLSRRIATLREALLDASAMLAYSIDFPEEDDGPIAPARPLAALGAVQAQLARLLATSADGERVRRGAMVVLAGPPNAGKSTLFNALLGQERALVTEIAGTTRDAIEADTTVDGWPVRLVDTAGLRNTTDRIEVMGVEVSRRYLESADIVLLCNELFATQELNEHLFTQDQRMVSVLTKADLQVGDFVGSADYFAVSAHTGTGIAELRSHLAERLFGGVVRGGGDVALLTRERHRVAVTSALGAVESAVGELGAGEVVLAAHQVQAAVAALDELIGVVEREEVFDRVFRGFCVGK